MQSAVLGGLSIEYEIKGSGEPIALIHLALYADSFLPLMDQPALAGYQLIRYHRRGYVGSSRTAGRITIPDNASDLASLLGYLGIKRVHVVGHSYGGLVALQLALDHPDLVASLVLMEPPLLYPAAGQLGPASQELTRRMAIVFKRYRDGDLEGAADAFLAAVFAPGFRQLLDQISPGGWAQTVRDADTFFGKEQPEAKNWQFGETDAKRINIPMLSVRGALSHPAFSEFEQVLRDWFPHLETALIPGVDHKLHLQRPDLVALAVAEFLARHPLS